MAGDRKGRPYMRRQVARWPRAMASARVRFPDAAPAGERGGKKMLTYIYGMRLRGYSPGCQPKEGFLMRLDDPKGKYFDLLSYNRELSFEEMRDYELDFLTTLPT